MKRNGCFKKTGVDRSVAKGRKIPKEEKTMGVNDDVRQSVADAGLRKDLERLGIEYDVVVIDLDSIDWNSNEYQTRTDVFDVALSSDYAQAISGGASLPEMLFEGKHTVCGRHRGPGYVSAGVRFVWGLRVRENQPDIKRRLLSISENDNLRNGKRVTWADKYRRVAKQIIKDNGGLSEGYPGNQMIRNACEFEGVPRKSHGEVRRFVRVELFKEKCIAEGSPVPPDDISEVCYSLESLHEGPEIVKRICENLGRPGVAIAAKNVLRRKLAGSAAIDFLDDTFKGKASGEPKKATVETNLAKLTQSFSKAFIARLKKEKANGLFSGKEETEVMCMLIGDGICTVTTAWHNALAEQRSKS